MFKKTKRGREREINYQISQNPEPVQSWRSLPVLTAELVSGGAWKPGVHALHFVVLFPFVVGLHLELAWKSSNLKAGS